MCLKGSVQMIQMIHAAGRGALHREGGPRLGAGTARARKNGVRDRSVLGCRGCLAGYGRSIHSPPPDLLCPATRSGVYVHA